MFKICSLTLKRRDDIINTVITDNTTDKNIAERFLSMKVFLWNGSIFLIGQ